MALAQLLHTASLALVLLAGSSCAEPFDPEHADLSWLFLDEGDAYLSEYPFGTQLDYAHEGGSMFLQLTRAGTFEVRFLNCGSTSTYFGGSWTAPAPGVLRLDADQEFGFTSDRQVALMLRETDSCGEIEVWEVDAGGSESLFSWLLDWSVGQPCLSGCCTFEGGVCDPTVVYCDAAPCEP